jgi:hypothetical protein
MKGTLHLPKNFESENHRSRHHTDDSSLGSFKYEVSLFLLFVYFFFFSSFFFFLSLVLLFVFLLPPSASCSFSSSSSSSSSLYYSNMTKKLLYPSSGLVLFNFISLVKLLADDKIPYLASAGIEPTPS